ncbi:RHS repeat domain-containing protein, partial [Paenibacillus sp. GCM10023250]|uniref:RHS repeat domain-containing protein n=1 Tax=Paenibacillus sp. GCM10023250 TaxID=3252648 RepID=UPI00361B5ED6
LNLTASSLNALSYRFISLVPSSAFILFHTRVFFDCIFIVALHYAYYRNDKVKTITHGNNFTSNYVYDGLDLKSLQHKKTDGAVVNAYDYESDWSGNVTKRTENGTVNNYTYDPLGQVLTNTQFHETYGYDARGNRTSLISDATPSIDNFNYTYDEWNQLTKVTDKDAATVSYTYNGDGLLYERTAGGTKTRYYWDDQRLIGEATVSGTTVTPKASYVYGNGLLERIDGSNLTRATYLLNGHQDVVELRDNSGAVLNKYTYDIWGKPLSVSETVDNPFWYSSEYWDKKTGLQYLRARWYNPETARFISEDTYEGELKNPNSLNLYTYVENNPLTHTDPSGHWLIDAIFLAADVVSFVKNPSLANAAWIAGDVASFADPTGAASTAAHVAKGAHAVAEGVHAAEAAKVSGKITGGSFKAVNATKGSDEVGHHIAQNAYNKTQGISRDDGPAVLMSIADHAETRTYKGKGKAAMRVDAGLNGRQRMAKDVWDVKKNFGTKYNQGLRQAVRYGQKIYQKE